MNNTRSISSAATVGLFEAIVCATLMLLITNIIPFFFKNWFVEPTGDITVAPFFGFLLALGILFRQNWARHGAILLSVFIAVANSMSLGVNPQKPGFWVLSSLNVLLLCLLIFSEKLKQYVR